MSLLNIVLIAFGLAADAFAVSVAEGIRVEKLTHRHALRVPLMFGTFQGVMPVLGWVAGDALSPVIGSFDHWVAFGLLGFLGGKMIAGAVFGIESPRSGQESTGVKLLGLALVTSIDAFAVGVTLAMLRVRVWTPAAVIAVITALLSAFGIRAGDRIGVRLGRAAEVLGGCVLVGLGVKILLQHLT